MRDELSASIAVQDQEWAEAREWLTNPANAAGVARLTMASVAPDAAAVTRLMQSHPVYAEVVQRMVCLVIVEILHRTSPASPGGEPTSDGV